MSSKLEGHISSDNNSRLGINVICLLLACSRHKVINIVVLMNLHCRTLYRLATASRNWPCFTDFAFSISSITCRPSAYRWQACCGHKQGKFASDDMMTSLHPYLYIIGWFELVLITSPAMYSLLFCVLWSACVKCCKEPLWLGSHSSGLSCLMGDLVQFPPHNLVQFPLHDLVHFPLCENTVLTSGRSSGQNYCNATVLISPYRWTCTGPGKWYCMEHGSAWR